MTVAGTMIISKNLGKYVQSRCAQPFCYWRPHYFYFYDLRPPVSLRQFYCFALLQFFFRPLSLACFHTFGRLSAEYPHTVDQGWAITLARGPL